jgi:hypothetical protein
MNVERTHMNRESFKTMPKPFGFQMPKPSWLDRLADAELQMGHHDRAEQLSRQAAEMREAS